MIKTLVLLITTLKFTQTQSQLSYYIDRSINPHTLTTKDYLHLFLDNSENSEKLVYRLPVDLKNKEVFKIKICKKGTVEILKQKNSEQEDVLNYNYEIDTILNENCLFDEFNTISIIDYKKKLFLEQNPIFNLYKICDYGFSFQEAERSFTLSSIKEIQYRDILKKEDLYYINLDKIVELVKEAEKEDFREIADKNPKSRCNLEFNQTNLENLTLENFLQETYFHVGDNSKSDFIIEYNFDEEFVIEQVELEDFKTEDMNPEKIIKTRESILKKMEIDYVIVKKEFPQAKIQLKIRNFDEDGLGTKKHGIEEFTVKKHVENFDEDDEDVLEEDSMNIDVNVNENLEINSIFNLYFPVNSYIRFFPMICLENLDKNSEYSYEFISDNHCSPISHKKILLVKNEKKNIHFFYKESGQIFQTDKIDLKYDEFNLEFYAKDNIMKKMMISGFQEKCDAIYDQKLSLMYFICYQKISNKKKRILSSEEKLSQKNLTSKRILSKSYNFETDSNLFNLKENSIKKLQKHDLNQILNKNQNIYKIIGINFISIGIIGAIVALTMGTFIGWVILLLGVFFFFLTIFLFKSTKNQNFKNRMTKDEIQKMKKKILNRSFYSEFVFDEKLKEDENLKFVKINWLNREGYLKAEIDKIFEKDNLKNDEENGDYSDPDNKNLKKVLLVN